MADHTGIEWADATWNPIVGCSLVSPGCTNCYAMKQAARIEAMQPGSHYAGTTQASKAGAVWSGKLALAPDHIITQPLRWRRPRRIFVNSMGDLFHEDAPEEWIDHVFAVMALAPQHTFMVLTKRPARMREYFLTWPMTASAPDRITDLAHKIAWGMRGLSGSGGLCARPLPNVWLGVSTERQAEWDARVPDLKATPAAVRFVSAEPLLGPIVGDFSLITLAIVGGESGPKARPIHPDWARSLRDQCAVAGTAFFFKQWGEWAPEEHLSIEQAAKTYEADLLAGRTWRFTGQPMRRLGKHHLDGRRLDGVEHNAMPEVRS